MTWVDSKHTVLRENSWTSYSHDSMHTIVSKRQHYGLRGYPILITARLVKGWLDYELCCDETALS